MKPMIGLIPLYDGEKDSYWMLPGYMKVLEACGALPVMLPLTDDPETLDACFEMCGGLLLTGGQDVEPALYGEGPIPQCGTPCALRDRMEQYLFCRALEQDKPVLGICRGIQLMNVLLGGSLYQDLPFQHPSKTVHCMKPPYDVPVHSVEVLEDTLLARIIGSGAYRVNSYHHQAVRTLAPSATAMALSEDGLVEAICVPGRTFIAAVQWHPELAYKKDPKCKQLIQAFVNATESGR